MVHSVKKIEGEAIRTITTEVFEMISPKLSSKFMKVVDVVHPMGPKREHHCHQVIILFSVQCYHDSIWKKTKQSKLLHENSLQQRHYPQLTLLLERNYGLLSKRLERKVKEWAHCFHQWKKNTVQK